MAHRGPSPGEGTSAGSPAMAAFPGSAPVMVLGPYAKADVTSLYVQDFGQNIEGIPSSFQTEQLKKAIYLNIEIWNAVHTWSTVSDPAAKEFIAAATRMKADERDRMLKAHIALGRRKFPPQLLSKPVLNINAPEDESIRFKDYSISVFDGKTGPVAVIDWLNRIIDACHNKNPRVLIAALRSFSAGQAKARWNIWSQMPNISAEEMIALFEKNYAETCTPGEARCRLDQMRLHPGESLMSLALRIKAAAQIAACYEPPDLQERIRHQLETQAFQKALPADAKDHFEQALDMALKSGEADWTLDQMLTEAENIQSTMAENGHDFYSEETKVEVAYDDFNREPLNVWTRPEKLFFVQKCKKDWHRSDEPRFIEHYERNRKSWSSKSFPVQAIQSTSNSYSSDNDAPESQPQDQSDSDPGSENETTIEDEFLQRLIIDGEDIH